MPAVTASPRSWGLFKQANFEDLRRYQLHLVKALRFRLCLRKTSSGPVWA
jgi:hypothetical protein